MQGALKTLYVIGTGMGMTRVNTGKFSRAGWFAFTGKRLSGDAPAAQPCKSRSRPLLLGAAAVASLAVACGFSGSIRAAPKLTVLYSFGALDGFPDAALIADSAGNLYGTTYEGGAFGNGDVFVLSPPVAGTTKWTETVLHSFNQADGNRPIAGLLADSTGNLYGATEEGGADDDGVVFELSPPVMGNNVWTEAVLHSFNGHDGAKPEGTLIADGQGNLYGTAAHGGANDAGAVFELSPPTGGQTTWTEKFIHAFDKTKGAAPFGSLIADGAGNLYGTAYGGGPHGDGVVFELSPPAVGETSWTKLVLQSFNGIKGAEPAAGLLVDGAGNLYGATYGGGHGSGVVFELSPPVAGKTSWAKKVIHFFGGRGGADSGATLIADRAGNLYGTTYYGGSHGDGVVFELSPPAAGMKHWTETVLHSFTGKDGQQPEAGLIADAAGNLYGTTYFGGANRAGVAFKLTP